jgi:hypothetical protein
VEPTKEGSIETRPGRVLGFNTANAGAVHSLKHYSATELLIGAGTALYRGTTSIDTGFSGNPLGIISFLPPEGSREWFYISDSSQLRKATSNAATATQRWGIVAPAAALTFVAAAGGDKDSAVFNASVYDYRATYYNEDTGAESNPSPIASGSAITGANGSADIDVVASADTQVTNIRIYQRGGVNDVGRSVWRLIQTVPNADDTITDTQADSAILGNAALQLDNYGARRAASRDLLR